MGEKLASGIAHHLPKSSCCVSAPRTLLLFALAVTVARLAFVWLTEPSPAEAYYYLCSQRLAPAYFDGPAGTALVTELASVYGKSDIIWRLTAPLWSLIATCACFGFVRQLSDARQAAYVALVLNVLPIFNSAALRVGPELSTLTFVTLGMLAAWRASGAEAGKLVWWVGSGLFFGIGDLLCICGSRGRSRSRGLRDVLCQTAPLRGPLRDVGIAGNTCFVPRTSPRLERWQ